jgi:hypothetical protein
MFFSFTSAEQKLLEDRNDRREVLDGYFGVFVTKLENDFIESLKVTEYNFLRVV